MITKQPYSALIVHKLDQAKAGLRLKYYKFLGMQVKAGSTLGKIKCRWPSRVILGNKCDLEDGVSFKIAHPFSTENYVQMGDGVFVGQGCEFNCSTKIIIGNDCLIASNTTFVDAGREISNLNLNINEQPCVFGEISIGDDVWIGTHSIILRGVSIGKGSVIGAGSVVNKSVPAYQVWAGAPARFIKNR